MKTRNLGGGTRIAVSALESRATLDRALERAVTFYDTADMYGIGKNEEPPT